MLEPLNHRHPIKLLRVLRAQSDGLWSDTPNDKYLTVYLNDDNENKSTRRITNAAEEKATQTVH